MRRSHRKSRTGCLPCKQRHVKCDEARPVCRLCANSNRECRFPGTEAMASGSTLISEPELSSSDTALNIQHIELIVHMMTNKDMFNLSFNVDDHLRGVISALKTGLKAPYLLHQLLALSARHLASLHPAKSADYLHLATALQTRAVSLFNATSLIKHVDSTNCVAITLFSSVLAHHVLADTLTRRDYQTLDGFLAHYAHAIEVTRGVMVVSMAAWPLLMATEGGPTIAASAGFTMREGRGSHCEALHGMVEHAPGLSEAEREECRRAVRRLQVGFDAVEEEGKEDSYRFQMIFAWTMTAPPELAALLAAKRPEVLVMLGYYALLLHYGREMWQVGDAGEYLLGLIVEDLPPEWHYLLQYPRDKMDS
ncbi:putative C6 finger domain protein [Echria macrotheca]|uniref:C6 finger domain protein n=1 Tax=Echria macrotheca TaxID=438768 RepID=A0AAJ0F8D5_9PEZI|nr:putative C6 finger domain protein [Echria macrotheca]